MSVSAPKPLAMIAAMSANRVIGRGGQMPWHEPEDLKHFRRITTGHTVIMGRKTWDTLGKALPKRRNIVVSRAASLALPEAETFTTLDAAIDAAYATDTEPMIIGGAEIYRLALSRATHIYLTMIDRHIDGGDAFFPELDATWHEASRRDVESLSFREYLR